MGSFAESLQQIDGWVEEGVVRGAAAAIWQDGDIVETRVAGEAAPGIPVRDDTLFALASVSKPVTAAAVMAGVDAGDLTLETPLAALVPEFGEVDDPLGDDVLPQLEALRDRITIRHLLSHTSGLPENVGVSRVRMRDLPSLEAIVDAMCGVPLVSEPGSELRYSNVGFGLVARALERATGTPFLQYVREKILVPTGIEGIAIQPGPDLADRIALVDDPSNAGTPAERYNSPYWRNLAIPWGGYFGTPSGIARFAATFLPGQASPLSADSRHEMTIDQTGGVPGGVHSAGILWRQGAWGLGWEVANGKAKHWTGSLRSPQTFCHWGQAGTLLWADPERSLVLAVFANRSVHRPWPLRPPRWHDLSDAVVEQAG
jgi:CubicO group peptidase (beta-lactamase class C family)